MNTINKDELFTHVREFLKAKGIDLQEGSYARTIHKGCQVLADTINLSQQAVERARNEVEKNLERVRQTIHEKTAPRKPPVVPKTEPAPAREPKAEAPVEQKPASEPATRPKSTRKARPSKNPRPTASTPAPKRKRTPHAE